MKLQPLKISFTVAGLALCCIIAFGVFSCKRETPCPGDTALKFTHEDTLIIPYTGTDSMWFEVSDSNDVVYDTLLFVGKGKVHNTVGWKRYGGPDEECSGEIALPGIQMEYQAVNSGDKISVQLKKSGEESNIKNNTVIVWVYVDYNSYNFVATRFSLDGDFGYYRKSTFLNGREYLNVVQSIYPQNGDTSQMLMNKTQGILRINFEGGVKKLTTLR